MSDTLTMDSKYSNRGMTKMARSEHSANAQMAQAALERREARQRMTPQAAPRKQDDAARAEILRRLGAA